MKESIKSIEPLVQEELDRANKKFPQFASPHEGYAVLLEEVEETTEELENLKWEFEKAWEDIKKNNDALEHIKLVKEFAEFVAAESIQVAAMAQKFIDMAEREEK